MCTLPYWKLDAAKLIFIVHFICYVNIVTTITVNGRFSYLHSYYRKHVTFEACSDVAVVLWLEKQQILITINR